MQKGAVEARMERVMRRGIMALSCLKLSPASQRIANDAGEGHEEDEASDEHVVCRTLGNRVSEANRCRVVA